MRFPRGVDDAMGKAPLDDVEVIDFGAHYYPEGVDTCGFFGYHAPIETALEELPPSQLLFGTDYPWEPRDVDELAQLADSIAESSTQGGAEQILGGNALNLMVNL